MAGKDKEQRKAERQAKKQQLAADIEKVRQADESYKQAREAEKKPKVNYREPIIGQEKKDGVPADAGVTHVQSSPLSKDVVTTYPTLSEYAKANPTTENVVPTLDGKDPKTDVTGRVISTASTYNEAKAAPALGEAVAQDIDNTAKAADEQSFQESIANSIESQNAIDENATRVNQAGYMQSSNLGDIARSGIGSYDLTEEQYQKMGIDHRSLYAAMKANAPDAAVEKLDMEDYYPHTQDFVTSNFTGRYIGSRQLVASTGALIPQGMFDARQRANQEKAKANIDNQKKFWELASTAPQYDERYKDIGMDMLDRYYELSGGDIDSLFDGKSNLSIQFMREMKDFESRGKAVVDANTMIESFLEDIRKNDGKTYMPPEIIKSMYDFRSGTADLDEYMSGEGMGDEKMRRIVNSIRSYQNFTPLADEKIKQLSSLGADKLPIRQDVDWSNPETAVNMQQALNKVKSRDYHEFRTVMGEFFKVDDIETIVNQLYNDNNLWEGTTKEEADRQKQSAVRYFMAMLPDKIDIEQKFQATQNLGWARLGFDKEQAQQENIWEMANRNLEEDKAMTVGAVKNARDKKGALANALRATDKNVVEVGGITMAEIPSRGTETFHVKGDNVMVISSRDNRAYSPEYILKKRQEELERMKSRGIGAGNKQYDEVAKEAYEMQHLIDNGKSVEVQVAFRGAGYTVRDQERGVDVPLESYNGNYDDSEVKNTGYVSGNFGVPKMSNGKYETDEKGNIIVEPSKTVIINAYNIKTGLVNRGLGGEEGNPQEERNKSWETKGQTQNEVYGRP